MRTLAELIRWRAQRHPDLDAVWYEGKTQNYGELNRSSSELPGALVEKLGLKPQDRVAIIDKNCPEYLEFKSSLDEILDTEASGQCPMLPNSGQNVAMPRMSALCQKQAFHP